MALCLLVCLATGRSSAQEFELSPPQIDIGLFQSPVFQDSLPINLRFDLADAEIRYTLDGTLPDQRATLFTQAFTLRKSCILRAIALHPDFRSSPPAQMQCIRADPKYKPKTAWLGVEPSVKYPGKGVTTLLDFQKGHQDLSRNQWLGFEGTDLDITLELERIRKPSALMVSTLTAPGSWVYPPQRITVWAGRRKKKGYRKVYEFQAASFSGPVNGMEEKIYTLPLQKRRARYWRVLVENYGALPEGHPGKGTPAWLFVDEIIMQ